MRAAGTYIPRSSGRPLVRGLGAINCNPFPFSGGQGLVDPACWCLFWGSKICDATAGAGTYAAALALNSGGPAAPAAPPIVPAIDPNTPPPSSADEANASIAAVVAQQWQDWKDQNTAFFTSVANTAESNTPAVGGSGLSTTAVVAMVAGGVALLVFLGGRRRG